MNQSIEALRTSPPGRPVQFQHQLDLYRKHSAMLELLGEYYPPTPVHISTAVYSQVIIYTAEWTGAPWREHKCQGFETVATRIQTWAPSIGSSTFYRCSVGLDILIIDLLSSPTLNSHLLLASSQHASKNKTCYKHITMLVQ